MPARASKANADAGRAEGDEQAPPHPEHQGEGPIAAAAILLELVDLGERIERREQGTEASSTNPRAGSSGTPVAAQPAYGVSVPKPNMLMIQSAPGTAFKRNGGTEYSTESPRQTA